MRDLKAPDAACIRGFEIHMGIIDAMTVMNINAMRWTFHFHAFYIIIRSSSRRGRNWCDRDFRALYTFISIQGTVLWCIYSKGKAHRCG